MTLPAEVITGIATTFSTLIGVVLGVLLGGRTQRSHWARETRLRACADLLRGYTAVFLVLGAVCRKGGRVSPEVWADWEQVLASLSLVAPPDVFDAAVKLDEAFWRVNGEVEGGARGGEAWIVVRRPIETARTDFVNVARRRLMSGSGGDLQTVRGRPAEDDPMWARRREPVIGGPDLSPGVAQD